MDKFLDKIYEDIRYATSVRETPQKVTTICSNSEEIIIFCGINEHQIRLDKNSFEEHLKKIITK